MLRWPVNCCRKQARCQRSPPPAPMRTMQPIKWPHWSRSYAWKPVKRSRSFRAIYARFSELHEDGPAWNDQRVCGSKRRETSSRRTGHRTRTTRPLSAGKLTWFDFSLWKKKKKTDRPRDQKDLCAREYGTIMWRVSDIQKDLVKTRTDRIYLLFSMFGYSTVSQIDLFCFMCVCVSTYMLFNLIYTYDIRAVDV